MDKKKMTVPNRILLPQICHLIDEGNEVVLLTKGNSMLPFIRGDRDSVVLRKPVQTRPGDIVLAEVSPDVFVLHRVISIGEKVVLMGDGNISGQEICAPEKIRAQAVAIIKDGKRKDCCSAHSRRLAAIWKTLLPFRRIILGLYRRICL